MKITVFMIIFHHFLCWPRGIINNKISIIFPVILKGILNGLDFTPEYLKLFKMMFAIGYLQQ